MKKAIVISLFTLSSSVFTLCEAQYVRPNENTPSTAPGNSANTAQNPENDNISIGGSFNLYFGNITYITLEPLLSYHFNKSLMIGGGPIYQYVSEDFNNGYGTVSSSSYGARGTLMFFLPEDLSRIFLMGEFDVLDVPEQNQNTGFLYRGTLTMPMLGLGYKDQVSDRLFFYLYGLWNFNTSYYNPFTNPIINAGFDVELGH